MSIEPTNTEDVQAWQKKLAAIVRGYDKKLCGPCTVLGFKSEEDAEIQKGGIVFLSKDFSCIDDEGRILATPSLISCMMSLIEGIAKDTLQSFSDWKLDDEYSKLLEEYIDGKDKNYGN